MKNIKNLKYIKKLLVMLSFQYLMRLNLKGLLISLVHFRFSCLTHYTVRLAHLPYSTKLESIHYSKQNFQKSNDGKFVFSPLPSSGSLMWMKKALTHPEYRWGRKSYPPLPSQLLSKSTRVWMRLLAKDYGPAKMTGFNCLEVWVPCTSQTFVNVAMFM